MKFQPSCLFYFRDFFGVDLHYLSFCKVLNNKEDYFSENGYKSERDRNLLSKFVHVIALGVNISCNEITEGH